MRWPLTRSRSIDIPSPLTVGGTLRLNILTVVLAIVLGILSGFGAALFTKMINYVTRYTVEPFLFLSQSHYFWLIGLCIVPALGLLIVSWLTRRFASESSGNGVPEVMLAVARHDGIIRPRVSIVTILASCICIGTGGSVGREGPIVQIGSSLGSTLGQFFRLSPRNIKVLVAAGAAAGISATFHAPLAGVVFACEIILGNFAVESPHTDCDRQRFGRRCANAQRRTRFQGRISRDFPCLPWCLGRVAFLLPLRAYLWTGRCCFHKNDLLDRWDL